MFNHITHITPVGSVLSVIIFVYWHCTLNMALWSVKIISCVYTSLILVKFSYFLMCLSWRPLVGMVTHKSGYQLYLCDRCSFTQKVLQDRTLHSHLVKCNWDEFLLLGLPTHNLRLWMVAYNLYLWEVAKVLCYNFRFCPHSFKRWRSVGRSCTFHLSVLVQGSSFISFSDCSKFQSLVVCLLACLGVWLGLPTYVQLSNWKQY